jgi:hypothetical protein
MRYKLEVERGRHFSSLSLFLSYALALVMKSWGITGPGREVFPWP